VLSGRRIRGRASKMGAFRLSLISILNCVLVMSLTAVFSARPTDELIGIYVVYNCCSVLLNRVTFQSRTVRGNCYCLVCKNCSFLEVILFVFFSFGHKCLYK
jgi:hypothetical protein